MLGTEVPGVGFELLEPRLELGSRVVGEGSGWVEGLGWCRHGGMDGWMKFLTSNVDTVTPKAKQYQDVTRLSRDSKLEL